MLSMGDGKGLSYNATVTQNECGRQSTPLDTPAASLFIDREGGRASELRQPPYSLAGHAHVFHRQ
jgi:hypothetical protein